MSDDQTKTRPDRGLSNPAIMLIAGCVFFLVRILLNQISPPQSDREWWSLLFLSTLLSTLAGVPILALLSLLGLLGDYHSSRFSLTLNTQAQTPPPSEEKDKRAD